MSVYNENLCYRNMTSFGLYAGTQERMFPVTNMLSRSHVSLVSRD